MNTSKIRVIPFDMSKTLVVIPNVIENIAKNLARRVIPRPDFQSRISGPNKR
ncbi:MAG: hypothetical protein MKZ59_03525 [Deinococcales bacterium]|nr:hypothetical protein [Deinococcales bacterium]